MRSLLIPALFTLLMGAFLCGLGLWQLQRLAWKTALLDEIGERINAPPQPLPPPGAWASLKPQNYDYRPVAADGLFDHAKEALVFRSTAAGPGYFVLTPLQLLSGGTVIVNRGFVPLDHAQPATRAAGQSPGIVHVTGLMRPPEPRNLFTPADNPAKGEYFTRDPALIAAHFGLSQAAPFTIDAAATPVPGGWPLGGTTELAIPNNHLSYALTWFGLALGLVSVFAVFAWRKVRTPRPRASLRDA